MFVLVHVHRLDEFFYFHLHKNKFLPARFRLMVDFSHVQMHLEFVERKVHNRKFSLDSD